MPSREAMAGPSPRFDAFLFAPVGEDRNGMLVSVLSALARLGVDPWAEAAALSDLPEVAALDRLDAMLVTLGDVPSVRPDHRNIVVRLIALLPSSSAIGRAPAKAMAAGKSAPPLAMTAIWIGLLLVVLFGQAVALRPAAPVDGAANPVAPVRIQTGGTP